MPFIIPAIVAGISAVEGFVATGLMFIPGMTIGGALATSSFLVDAGLSMGLNMALGAINGHPQADNGAARQASVVQMAYGEQSRWAIFGRAGVAGSLVHAFNHGGDYGTDWETLIIRLADHECDGLDGIWVNDTWLPYAGDGLQSTFNNQLQVYWLSGAADQTLPGYVYDAAPNGGGWDPNNKMTGMAGLVVSYLADKPDSKSPTWPGGRPKFLPVVRGKRCYDPRRDSSLGGDGAHRWADPSTWEWTENAYICRYNWARGVFSLDQIDKPDQLIVGRGFTEFEAPPLRAFAPANICDEVVEISNGTEARYRIGGVIKAGDDFATVEGWFSDAMAGTVIQPQGGIEIEPGQSKVPVQITDADLVTGAALEFDDFGSSANRVNTVTPSYIDPDQKWQTTSGTPQRDYTDILSDGGPLVETLALPLVTSRTQAERIGAIRRRKRRLERAAKIVLGPQFSQIEDGDWIEWTSARYTNGQPVTFVVSSYALGSDWRNALALTETSDAVFDPADHFFESPGLQPIFPPDSLALGHVGASAALISGDDGEAIPCVQFVWDVPVDAAIQAIRAEIRRPDQAGTVTATLTNNVSDGHWLVTNGVGSNYTVQVRLVPVSPGRFVLPSDWQTLALGESVMSNAIRVGNRLAAEVLQQLDDTIAQGDQLVEDLAAVIQTASDTALTIQGIINDANETAEAIIAAALQGADTRGYLDTLTHIDGDSLVKVVKAIGVYDADKGAFIIDVDRTEFSDDGSTIADRFSAVKATGDSNSALVTAEQTARIAADAVFTSTLALQGSVKPDGSAWVVNENTTEVGSRGTLATVLNALTASNGASNASITAEQTARIAADAVFTSTLALQGSVKPGGAAWVVNENTTEVGGRGTLATVLNGLSATDATNTAAISAEQTARITADGVEASARTALATTVAGQTSSINFALSALNGNQATAILAASVGNVVTGFVLNGAGHSFAIYTSTFAIIDPGSGAGNAPFLYSGGTFYLDAAMYVQSIIANSITTNHLVGAAVTSAVPFSFGQGAGINYGAGQIFLGDWYHDNQAGGPIEILISYTVTNPSSQYNGYYAHVYRDGGLIATTPYAIRNGFTQNQPQFMLDYPGLGTHHYEVYGEIDRFGSTMTVNDCSGHSLEFKR